jgi:hypothetical protein
MTDLEKALTLIRRAYERGGGCYLPPDLVDALVKVLFSRSIPVEEAKDVL